MTKVDDKHLQDLDLRSEDIQEILTAVPHWMIRWGNIIFLSLILLLLILSWFIKYPDIITSGAIITTEIPPQKEYAKASGRLDKILVVDKQVVSKNQPLAMIENAANFDDIFILKKVLDTIKFNKNNLYFPLDKLPILFLGDVESSYAEFEGNYTNYILNKDLKPFVNESLANQFSISELTRQLHSLISQQELNKEQLRFKEKDINRNKSLFEKGVISEQEYEIKQLEYLQEKRNFKSLNSSISQMNEALNNAKKNFYGTNINKRKEETILVRRLMQSYNNLKKSIKVWELNYLLKSNVEGKVSFLNIWNSNQNVNKGDLIFTITPYKNSRYIAKLETPIRNSGKIKIGQRVNIRLENYPDNEYGVLIGKVKRISSLPNNEGFYVVDVFLPEKLVTSYNKEIDFKDEMVGSAEIITEDLRLLERLFYQFMQVSKNR